jgi:hypothetical protein
VSSLYRLYTHAAVVHAGVLARDRSTDGHQRHPRFISGARNMEPGIHGHRSSFMFADRS